MVFITSAYLDTPIPHLSVVIIVLIGFVVIFMSTMSLDRTDLDYENTLNRIESSCTALQLQITSQKKKNPSAAVNDNYVRGNDVELKGIGSNHYYFSASDEELPQPETDDLIFDVRVFPPPNGVSISPAFASSYAKSREYIEESINGIFSRVRMSLRGDIRSDMDSAGVKKKSNFCLEGFRPHIRHSISFMDDTINLYDVPSSLIGDNSSRYSQNLAETALWHTTSILERSRIPNTDTGTRPAHYQISLFMINRKLRTKEEEEEEPILSSFLLNDPYESGSDLGHAVAIGYLSRDGSMLDCSIGTTQEERQSCAATPSIEQTIGSAVADLIGTHSFRKEDVCDWKVAKAVENCKLSALYIRKILQVLDDQSLMPVPYAMHEHWLKIQRSLEMSEAAVGLKHNADGVILIDKHQESSFISLAMQLHAFLFNPLLTTGISFPFEQHLAILTPILLPFMIIVMQAFVIVKLHIKEKRKIAEMCVKTEPKDKVQK